MTLAGVNILPNTTNTQLDNLLTQGFNCVELFSTTLNMEFNPTLIDKIKRLKLPSTIHIPNKFDLEKPINQSQDQVKEYLSLAQKLESKYIVIHANLQAVREGDQSIPKTIVRNLQQLVKQSSDYGATVCVENDEPYTDRILMGQRLTQHGSFRDEIIEQETGYDQETKEHNRKAFIQLFQTIEGLCATFDTGHARILTQQAIEFYDEIKDKVRVVHLNDNYGVKDDHLPLGEGDIDFKRFFQHCKENNFYGPFIIENKREEVQKSLGYFKNEMS